MTLIQLVKQWINNGHLVGPNRLCNTGDCFTKQKVLPMICKESMRSVKWNVQADTLASELSALCDNIDAWERSVEEIIGRQPEAGMCTSSARKALKSYFEVRNREIASIR